MSSNKRIKGNITSSTNLQTPNNANLIMNNANNKNYTQLTPIKMDSTERLKSIDD